MACFFDLFGDHGDMLAIEAVESDSLGASGHCSSDHEGACFDPVGNDIPSGSVKFFDTFDDDAARSRSADLGSHGNEEVGKVDDFRLTSGRVNDGGPFCEGGRHHDVVGAQDGGAVLSLEIDFGSREAIWSGDDHVSSIHLDVGSQRL